MDARKFLSDVGIDYCFWTKSGSIIHNIYQLAEALDAMGDDDYEYHHSTKKSDFANWVQDVLGDEELARKLRSAGSRKHAVRLIRKRIASMEHMLNKSVGEPKLVAPPQPAAEQSSEKEFSFESDVTMQRLMDRISDEVYNKAHMRKSRAFFLMFLFFLIGIGLGIVIAMMYLGKV